MENSFHDIIPPERRSIRNVTASHRPIRRSTQQIPERPESIVSRERPPEPPRADRGIRSWFSRFGLWIAAGVAVIVFVLAFSLLFSGTTVTIVPKQRDVSIDGQFKSFREATTGQLAHEIVSLEKTLEKVVPATGKREVEERASGQIIIFNNFSTTEQRLITNTRFETPDGLIYRIDKPVVLPGQKVANGETVPGSIEVTVYADEPGERYNIGLTDFTIPGFKGSPRFEGFFARSRTSMTGGFAGMRLTASDEDVARTRTELRTALGSELQTQAKSETPQGFYLFSDATFITYESLPQDERNGSVVLKEKAVLHGIVYRVDELARFVATQTAAGYEGESIAIQDLEGLTYSSSVTDEVVQQWEAEAVSFSLKGSVKLIWKYDEKSLKESLAGRSKEALPTILSGFPSIQEAKVSVQPFWRQTFPSNEEKITVKQSLE